MIWSSWPPSTGCVQLLHPRPLVRSWSLATTTVPLLPHLSRPLFSASTKYDSYSVRPSCFLFKGFTARGMPRGGFEMDPRSSVRACVSARARVWVFSPRSALSRLRIPLGIFLKGVVFSILTEHWARVSYVS